MFIYNYLSSSPRSNGEEKGVSNEKNLTKNNNFEMAASESRISKNMCVFACF